MGFLSAELKIVTCEWAYRPSGSLAVPQGSARLGAGSLWVSSGSGGCCCARGAGSLGSASSRLFFFGEASEPGNRSDRTDKTDRFRDKCTRQRHLRKRVNDVMLVCVHSSCVLVIGAEEEWRTDRVRQCRMRGVRSRFIRRRTARSSLFFGWAESVSEF